ncbi:DUF3710 domain-containing protein [Streptomyces melanogenes]|uniref:DUF3710 domain-containing protein n=1 Tax=Streptomyces melanogenes TaxID=67326 RepID=UPI0037B5A3E0
MEIKDQAVRILTQFSRDGFVSPESEAIAKRKGRNQITPGSILIMALRIELKYRLEEAGQDAGQIASAMSRHISREVGPLEVQKIIGFLAGAAPSPYAADRQQKNILLSGIVEMLSALMEERGLTDSEVDEFLALAEEGCYEVARNDGGVDAARRGLDIGPWHAGEHFVPADEYLDLGALWIPSREGIQIEPMCSDSTSGCASVTLVLDDTALQLQAFRRPEGSTWRTVRHDLLRKIRASQSTASETFGPAGMEIEANQAVTMQDGSSTSMRVRFLGCDGPGWFLRGVVTGTGAEPESLERWPYEVFLNTVVQPVPPGAGSDTIPLRPPVNS